MRLIFRRREKGLSLIEVLLSMVVMGVGILAVVGVFPMAFRNARVAWVNNQMTLLAQRVMEEKMAGNAFISTTPLTYGSQSGESTPVGNEFTALVGGGKNKLYSYKITAYNTTYTYYYYKPNGYVQYWGDAPATYGTGATAPNYQKIYVKVVWWDNSLQKTTPRELTLTGAVCPQ